MTYVINSAGRVQTVSEDLASQLVAKGSHKYIRDPKQLYYPEYDKSLSAVEASNTIDLQLLEGNSLDVELL